MIYECNLVQGIGDKLLHLISLEVLSKHLNIKLNFHFVDVKWGRYDTKLFDFKCDVSNDYSNTERLNPRFMNLSLYNQSEYFNKDISKDFIQFAENIKPSWIIERNIPDMENVYGIHLRKSDKVISDDLYDEKVWKLQQNPKKITHILYSNSKSEYKVILEKIKEDVKYIIANETNPKFFLCSEDNVVKADMRNYIHDLQGRVIDVDYDHCNLDGYSSVLDLFCLSRCKCILQGTKYSSFSISAALIGKSKRVINYLSDERESLIHVWTPCLTINNSIRSDENMYDINKTKYVCGKYNDLENIISILEF